jgi:hypothetical protein
LEKDLQGESGSSFWEEKVPSGAQSRLAEGQVHSAPSIGCWATFLDFRCSWRTGGHDSGFNVSARQALSPPDLGFGG